MTRALLAALLALSLAPGAARAEDVPAAARRVAISLQDQLAPKPGRPAVASVALSPVKVAPGIDRAGSAPLFMEYLQAELGKGGKLQLRSWQALDATQREKTLAAALAGGFDLPRLPDVQALLVADASGGGNGPLRIQLRVVGLPAGNVLAVESVRLDAAAKADTAPVQAEGVDVAMRRIADALAGGFEKLPGNARYRRLAVLPFSETGDDVKRRELGTVVAAELSTDLRRDHGFLLVERARLGAILSEVKLGEMGLLDPRQAPRLGKMADAQALVVGTVSLAGDRYLVNARVVSTDTAEALAVASEQIASSSMIALSSDAVVLRSRKDALFRSMLLPGWGQVYNRQELKGAMVATAEAGLLGAALTFHLLGAKAESDYTRKTTAEALGSDPAAAARALRADADRNYRLRNAFLWAAGGLWAVNVVDAYASGVDGEKALAGGIAVAPSLGAGVLGLAVAGRF